MQAVTTIGLDIAKSVFQVHGVDAATSASRSAIKPRCSAANSAWRTSSLRSRARWFSSSRERRSTSEARSFKRPGIVMIGSMPSADGNRCNPLQNF